MHDDNPNDPTHNFPQANRPQGDNVVSPGDSN